METLDSWSRRGCFGLDYEVKYGSKAFASLQMLPLKKKILQMLMSRNYHHILIHLFVSINVHALSRQSEVETCSGNETGRRDIIGN